MFGEIEGAGFEIIEARFKQCLTGHGRVERLWTGARWLEGPAWFAAGRYLLLSDIPNDRMLRWDETSGVVSEFRKPANNSNGNTVDREGRLVTCEHLTRRVTRTEVDGSITVIADSFEGKRLNSPNDIVCKSDGSVWFTDPSFGIAGNYEGDKATPEVPHGVYRIAPHGGKLERVLDDLAGPNGLCFSPDESTLYVVESRAEPNRLVWAYDVTPEGRLQNRRKHLDADGPGAFDGIKCDIDGNLWCGWGSNGRPGVDAAKLDGVMVFNPQGEPIGHVHLPERCANLCFGGAKKNRLFMASSHSVYSLFVETRGTV